LHQDFTRKAEKETAMTAKLKKRKRGRIRFMSWAQTKVKKTGYGQVEVESAGTRWTRMDNSELDEDEDGKVRLFL
jgi:hypothetical protein